MLRAFFVVVKIMELVLIYDESWFRWNDYTCRENLKLMWRKDVYIHT